MTNPHETSPALAGAQAPHPWACDGGAGVAVRASPIAGGYWIETKDGDPRGLFLYERHYSARRYRDGRKRRLFVGPGEKVVLLTPYCDALFVWRKFRSTGNQHGVNCAVFRNESGLLSSDLIREACELAWRRWAGERLYTYVEDAKVRSTNPGCCFLKAGWRRCGRNKDGRLTVLECLPPEPHARAA